MEKRIFIVAVSKGWTILSQKGKRLAGIYGSPNHALKIARPLAAAQGAEIVIYSNRPPSLQKRRMARNWQEGKKMLYL